MLPLHYYFSVNFNLWFLEFNTARFYRRISTESSNLEEECVEFIPSEKFKVKFKNGSR